MALSTSALNQPLFLSVLPKALENTLLRKGLIYSNIFNVVDDGKSTSFLSNLWIGSSPSREPLLGFSSYFSGKKALFLTMGTVVMPVGSCVLRRNLKEEQFVDLPSIYFPSGSLRRLLEVEERDRRHLLI